jgi:hypothetical protein
MIFFALAAVIFFALCVAGILPVSLRPASLWGRLLLNIGSKCVLLALISSTCEIFHGISRASMCVWFAAMLPLAAFALCSGNYGRFFNRTDLVQSMLMACFPAVFGEISFGHASCVLASFAVPYLASNALLISVGFFMEKLCGEGAVYVEDFHNLFRNEKVVSLSLLVAMVFLAGIPPLNDFLSPMFATIAREISLGRASGEVNGGFTIATLCFLLLLFFTLGCAYLRWILAAFRRVPERAAVKRRPFPLVAKLLVTACASVVVIRTIFI